MILDIETHLITPTMPAPRIVCVQWGEGGKDTHMAAPVTEERLRVLLDHQGRIEGQNLAYDMSTIGYRFPALLGRTLEVPVYCTMIAAKLHDAYSGYEPFKPKYSLAALVERYFDEDISELKNDPTSWRMRYRELQDVPLDRWPAAAKHYALQDVVVEARVRDYQASECNQDQLQHVERVTQAAIALRHSTCRGVRIDQELLAEIDAAAKEECEKADRLMVMAGFATRSKAGKLTTSRKKIQDLVRACFDGRDEPAPSTAPSPTYPGGQVKTDETTLILSEHPVLMEWAAASAARKVISSYTTKWLEFGGHRIHPEYDVPKSTGRTSCRAPNIQQFPRPSVKMANHGAKLRSCLLPEEGHVWVWADYAQIELVALAQLCLWRGHGSQLARDLNGGEDVHSRVARMLVGQSADPEELKPARQDAKAFNYGVPGGMRVNGIRKSSAAQGRPLSLARAKALEGAHAAAYPDVIQYVRNANDQWRENPWAEAPHPDLPPYRRMCTRPTMACNTPFQALCAMGALDAWVEMWRSAADGGLAWWPVLFIHDEIVCTVPLGEAESVGRLLVTTMERCMQRYMPDVHVSAGKATIAQRWGKE